MSAGQLARCAGPRVGYLTSILHQIALAELRNLSESAYNFGNYSAGNAAAARCVGIPTPFRNSSINRWRHNGEATRVRSGSQDILPVWGFCWLYGVRCAKSARVIAGAAPR